MAPSSSSSTSASIPSTTPRVSSPLNPSSASSTPTIPSASLPALDQPPVSPAVPVPGPLRPRGHSISTTTVSFSLSTNGTALGGDLDSRSSSRSGATTPRPGLMSTASVSAVNLTRITSSPAVPQSRSRSRSRARGHGSSPSFPFGGADLELFTSSLFRSRSRSPARYDEEEDDVAEKDQNAGSSTPPNGPLTSWWGGSPEGMKESRPWKDAPRKKKTVPDEQTESWQRTRERVAKAAGSVLGTTVDGVHEALVVGIELLDFVPVPGLQAIAKTLLNIWDAVEQVDTNRLACLRLTERCADILLSVRQEVYEAGDTVAEELSQPIQKLTEAFTQVHQFLQKQVHRPFLKRYLKRDEILGQIRECDTSLGDALSMFNVSIQVRILKAVAVAEAERRAETQRLLESILSMHGQHGQPSSPVIVTSSPTPAPIDPAKTGISPALPTHPIHYPSTPPPAYINPVLEEAPFIVPRQDFTNKPGSVDYGPITMPVPVIPSEPSEVLPTLKDLYSLQNSLDQARDSADLRSLMRTALQTNSDVEMLKVLQVKRDEMPEAIKTLQRALEREVERDGPSGSGGSGSGSGSGGSSSSNSLGRRQSVRSNDNASIQTGYFSTRTGDVQQPPLADVANGVADPYNSHRRSESLGFGDTATSSSSASSGPHLSRRPSAQQGAIQAQAQVQPPAPQPPAMVQPAPVQRDTLDQEFMETGIDALRRMSRGLGLPDAIPSWTITRYEVDRDLHIGLGFFSDVYRGTWRGNTVAIKVLAETTPQKLFVREVEIWRGLRHRNVLELYGASSASSDPPWFFVSPYLKNGSLVEWLKKVVTSGEPPSAVKMVGVGSSIISRSNSFVNSPGGAGDGGNGTPVESGVGLGFGGMGSGSVPGPGNGSGNTANGPGRRTSSTSTYPNWDGWKFPDSGRRERGGMSSGAGASGIPKEWDLLRYMYEIAKGMEYLHSQGVLHGDLKAANVLVDDRIHCVISDFGQSEMKNEAARLSGKSLSHGTLRWQAPELLMEYGHQQLTTEMDVYSFAICCVEVLMFGRIPWSYVDDETLRHIITRENSRPTIPDIQPFITPSLRELFHRSWDVDPFRRPAFSQIVRELKQLRRGIGRIPEEPTQGQPTSIVSPALASSTTLSSAGTPTSTSGVHPATISRLAEDIPTKRSRPSPDMRPIPLPSGTTPPQDGPAGILAGGSYGAGGDGHGSWSSTDDSYRTAAEVSQSQLSFQSSSYPQTTGRAEMIQHMEQQQSQADQEQFSPSRRHSLRPTELTHRRQQTHPNISSPRLSGYHGSMSGTVGPLHSGGPSDFMRWDDPTTPTPSNRVPTLQFPVPVFDNPAAMSSRGSSIYDHEDDEGTSHQGHGSTVYGGSKKDKGKGREVNTRTSSTSQSSEDDTHIHGHGHDVHQDGYESPPPTDPVMSDIKNERRYRLLLSHEFHPSLTLPLWDPSVIQLGDVGYLSKPAGKFITLFNSFRPDESENDLTSALPRVRGYGNFNTGSQRQDRRNAAQRGYDTVMGFLTSSKKAGHAPPSVARRYSFQLRAGHKAAFLCTESTMYRYVEQLEAPKKWFKLHVDQILSIYGHAHHIQKEDLFMVIGTLSTPDYGLFVSHNHGDGKAFFSVHSAPRPGSDWGTFKVDKDPPKDRHGGPIYDEPVSGTPLSAFKVSKTVPTDAPWKTVLVARLRFKPDVADPTSL
ncbi:hypothetical protein BDN72DRAFT_961779 [Pluteus cervinus]|uniref:Uncharacterized protein n=1 Tax=Pluteus cervinus TaxID=181527 RepID=A0ACD3ALK5_9AGAR|nr:hypothetical protein BDN72DRAFT_961779 [Pluteus cervinus]